MAAHWFAMRRKGADDVARDTVLELTRWASNGRRDEVPRKLELIETETIEDLLDDVVVWKDPKGRASMLEVLALDSRLYVKLKVADAIGTLAPVEIEDVEPVLAMLVNDPVGVVRQAASKALVAVLGRVDEFDRACFLLKWGTSRSHHCRAAIARAIAEVGATVGALTVVEHLSRDAYAEVRASAVDAAATLWVNGTRPALDVLKALCRDNRRSVRLAALSVFSRASIDDSLDVLEECVLSTDAETAETAAAILADHASSSPERYVASFERLVAHRDQMHDSALQTLIPPIASLGAVAPARARDLLAKLQDHSSPWLRDEASQASAGIPRPRYRPASF